MYEADEIKYVPPKCQKCGREIMNFNSMCIPCANESVNNKQATQGKDILSTPHPKHFGIPAEHWEAAKHYAEYAMQNKQAEPVALPVVEGDLLPAIGEDVLIHLASSDQWVPHRVVGYYVWGDLSGYKNLHRVFVQVVDRDGHLNARLLSDVRRLEKESNTKTHPAPAVAQPPADLVWELVEALELAKAAWILGDGDADEEAAYHKVNAALKSAMEHGL